LEQVIDHAEIERFKRVLAKRGRQDEHRPSRLLGMRADEIEALVVALASHQLDIDERDIDRHVARRALQDLASRIRLRDSYDPPRSPGFVDQLDEIFARRPLVLPHQRTELHERASTGTSMIESVRPFVLSSRNVPAPPYFSASRRVTNSI